MSGYSYWVTAFELQLLSVWQHKQLFEQIRPGMHLFMLLGRFAAKKKTQRTTENGEEKNPARMISGEGFWAENGQASPVDERQGV